jgi:hypothetical protein
MMAHWATEFRQARQSVKKSYREKECTVSMGQERGHRARRAEKTGYGTNYPGGGGRRFVPWTCSAR